MLTSAGGLVGLDISVNKDGDDTVATVKIYPHSMEVRVKRDEPYTNLWIKIHDAVRKLYAARHTQF